MRPIIELQSQSLARECFSLEKNKVDVWLVKNNIHPIEARNYLTQSDLKRSFQFYSEKDKSLFLYQHAWMNKILHLYLPRTNPQEFSYTVNNYGKPQLKGIEFNLSHSGEWIVLAITCENPVGVDIEKFCHLDYINIAQDLFSVSEVCEIKKLKKAKQAYAFFQIWSQKEAFIKATGMGLSYSTNTFEVQWNKKIPDKVLNYYTGQTWLVTRFLVEIGYSSAICYQENVNKINFFKLI